MRFRAIPSVSLSSATTVYANVSARAVPRDAPPVSRDAVLFFSPICRPINSAAPVADASQVTSADHVTFTRICAPRP